MRKRCGDLTGDLGNKKKKTHTLRVLLVEPDLAPMMGILLTMTDEPFGIRPSSSLYSEVDRSKGSKTAGQ